MFNSRISLSVVVGGYPQPSLQWYRNEEIIDGAITSVHVIPELTLDTRGLYYCSASNSLGKNESAKVYVKIRGNHKLKFIRVLVSLL